MSQWLLLAGADNTGMAVELIPGWLSNAPGSQSFEISLQPDKDDDLFDSAVRGGGHAFRLLKSEGYLQQSISVRFKLGHVPAGVSGKSADLLFALAVIVKAHPHPDGYPPLAATGVLDDKGWIQAVNGVPSKLRAALEIMPSGGIIFIPATNAADLDADLKQAAWDRGIDLCQVSRLDEAVARLGIAIRKVYLDNPYRGLEEFRYEHRGIYFGRQAEIDELIKRLRKREKADTPGILILAPSGAGKSSLVQAGLIPALEDQLHRINRRLSWQVWKPSDSKGKDTAALVQSVRDNWWEKLQEILGPAAYETLAEADTLISLTDSFVSIAPKDRHYLWLVNQMEELFTLGFTSDAIRQFTEFLRTLQNRGVWVVATLRNDFYPHYQNEPALCEVFGTEGGQYDLRRLDAAALEQIITRPAELADLGFEYDVDHVSLATRIRDEMAGEIDALPLLEFALTELYDKCRGQSILTFAAYQELGKLQGAIGNSAAALFQELDLGDDADTALRRVLWALSKSGRGSRDQTFTAQAALLADIQKESAEFKLIKRFIEKRLLVQDKERVRVAHEALLTHWPEAKAIIDGFLRDMEVRDQLTEEATKWITYSEDPSLLLPAGRRLSEGQDLLERVGKVFELNAELVRYIEASLEIEQIKQADVQAKQKRRLRIAFTVALIMGLLAIFAAYEAWQAEQQKHQAEANFKKARQSVDEFYTKVSEANLLNQPAMEPLRKELLEKAVKFYQEFTTQRTDDPAMREILAGAFNQLGTIKHTLGDSAGAVEAYRNAIAHISALAKNDPDDKLYQNNLGITYTNLGLQLRLRGDYVGARESYFAAIAIRKRLVKKHPDDPGYQNNLAGSYNALGIFFEQIGDSTNAYAYYIKMVALREKVAKKNPQTLKYQRLLAEGLDNLGRYQSSRDAKDANMHYSKALAIREDLARHNHEVVQFQHDLAGSLINLGSLHYRLGDKASAMKSDLRALDIQNHLVMQHPDVPDYQAALAIIYHNLATNHNASGNTSEALKFSLKALVIREKLVQDHPEILHHKSALALNYNLTGLLQSTIKDYKSTRLSYTKAISILEPIAKSEPKIQEYLIYTATFCEHLAMLEIITGHPKAAIIAAKRALKLDPSLTWIKINLAHGLLFDNQFSKASAIYRDNRDVKLEDKAGKTFAEVVLNDFRDFRAKGLTHPKMNKIERLLRSTSVTHAKVK